MKSAPTRTKAPAFAVTALAGIPLVLSGCGSSTAPGSGGPVTEISVVDYYNNEPDKSVIGDTLSQVIQGIVVANACTPRTTIWACSIRFPA